MITLLLVCVLISAQALQPRRLKVPSAQPLFKDPSRVLSDYSHVYDNVIPVDLYEEVRLQVEDVIGQGKNANNVLRVSDLWICRAGPIQIQVLHKHFSHFAFATIKIIL